MFTQNLQTILLVVQVLVAMSLIGFILIQHGKGADAGAAFGSGASSTVFGSQGSGNFLTRATAVLAFVFLTNSLVLGYIASKSVQQEQSIMQQETVSVMQQEHVESAAPEYVIPVIPGSDIPSIPE